MSELENSPVPPRRTDTLARYVLAVGGDVFEAFERAGLDRRQAVFVLDDLARKRGEHPLAHRETDPVEVLMDALLAGGWDKDVRNALRALAEATRPVGRAE